MSWQPGIQAQAVAIPDVNAAVTIPSVAMREFVRDRATGPQSFQTESAFLSSPNGDASHFSGTIPVYPGRPQFVEGAGHRGGNVFGRAACMDCGRLIQTRGEGGLAIGSSGPHMLYMPEAQGWGPSAQGFAANPGQLRSGNGFALAEQGLVQAGTRDHEYGELVSASSSDSAPNASPAVGETAASTGTRSMRLRRWSINAWAFLRRGGSLAAASGVLPATYGANQVGSVLRYKLRPLSALAPTLYLRTDATTGAGRYQTIAVGASVRPLRQIPVTLALEGRILDDSSGRHYQPVAMAVTQMPPFALPANLRGEIYAQAGYVGGQYATPFAEGQFRVDHGLYQIGKIETRIGGGAWGGIQTGASRLDAGPGISLSMPLNRKVFGRISADWRFRVGGNAHPGSGPALTLSAGF